MVHRTRRPLVAGNWKMHGTRQEAVGRLAALSAAAATLPCEVAVFPPYVHLHAVGGGEAAGLISMGAQDVSEHDAGAYTGEVSAAMLVEAGCRYVLTGHSERRALFGETDAVVAAKCVAALSCGLVPVVCVGETLGERDAGETAAVVRRQLGAVLDRIGQPGIRRVVVAYEPVWAIGTGRTASPEQAQEVHAMLRAQVAERDAAAASALRILYGGSVKAGNAGELFAMPDVDGGLVGGASLDAREFLEICAKAR